MYNCDMKKKAVDIGLSQNDSKFRKRLKNNTMKKTVFVTIFFAVFLGIIHQVEAQTLSNKKITLIENQIDSIFLSMLDFAERLDYDKISNGVDDKHKAGFITNGNYYSDYSSLIEVVKSSAQGVSNQRIVLNDKKITVLSDRIVLLTTSGTAHAKLNDGNQIKVNFHWSFAFEKIDGEWKVIHSHQSSTR